MITYRKGCLLKAFENGEVNVIAHGVNCQDTMRSGIAKAIAEKYPSVKEDYHKWCKEMKERDLPLLGRFRLSFVDDGKVLNCATQETYGYKGAKYVSYDAIDDIFRKIRRHAPKDTVLGIPKIGAGLGGGNWNIIEKIINEAIDDMEIFVYELE